MMVTEVIEKFHSFAEESGAIEATYEMVYYIVDKYKGDYALIGRLIEVVHREAEKIQDEDF